MQNLHNAWELPEEKDEKGQEDLEKINALFENKEDQSSQGWYLM